MKHYSPSAWAKLSPEALAAMSSPAASPGPGQFVAADLGWSCRCGRTSSDYPGVSPSWVSFPLHACGAAAWTNMLFALFMAVAVVAFVVLIRA